MNIRSLVVCFLIFFTLLSFRSLYPKDGSINVTTWDAFGYYAYLPATIIYHDIKKLDWLNEIDEQYNVTGGNGWQAEKAENGNWVFKYLGGVALLQLPFFGIGHFLAGHFGYPQDGFSAPYQYSLAYGVLLYSFIGLLVLRKLLLFYFDDNTTALSLLLVGLATNFITYTAIDNGLSHAYIFLLYTVVLFATFKWHNSPKVLWAAVIGYTIGLATISRPTEAIMLFIPLLYGMQNKTATAQKWTMVKINKAHIIIVLLFEFLGILPQLIYWKITSGSFIFDVGSKWDFLNPHFRVLFGWEKGWFIYTPVTVLFIIGMFLIKKFPFQKSALWFCLLNIWIIIAWSEWRYAASYSTRALVQSYPVFALPLATIIQNIIHTKWKIIFGVLCVYLIGVNIFQTKQYADGILHYDEMNSAYYGHIYLNPTPSPLDMSLLDNKDFLANETDYKATPLFTSDSSFHVSSNEPIIIGEQALTASNTTWLKLSVNIKSPNLWQSFLNLSLQKGDSINLNRVRLFNAISYPDSINLYEFYVQIPAYFNSSQAKIFISHAGAFEGDVTKISLIQLTKE